MGPEQALGALTFILLLGATFFSLAHVARSIRTGRKVAHEFSAIISIFIAVWVSTELVGVLSGGSLGQSADLFHFLILLVLAVVLTKRWRWAVVTASELER